MSGKTPAQHQGSHEIIKAINRMSEKYPWLRLVVCILIMLVSYLLYVSFVDWIRAPFRLFNATSLGAGIGIYMTIIGIIWALIISFTYQQAIHRQRTIHEALYSEARGLCNILLLVETMGTQEMVSKTTSIIKGYIKDFLEDKYGESAALYDASTRELFKIDKILRTEPSLSGDRGTEVTWEAVHDELTGIMSARSQRFAALKSELSGNQTLVIEVLGSLLFLGFLFFDMGVPHLEGLLFALLVGAYSLLWITLMDVDDPFNGQWQVEPRVMVNLLHDLEKEMEPP